MEGVCGQRGGTAHSCACREVGSEQEHGNGAVFVAEACGKLCLCLLRVLRVRDSESWQGGQGHSGPQPELSWRPGGGPGPPHWLSAERLRIRLTALASLLQEGPSGPVVHSTAHGASDTLSFNLSG